MKQNNAQQGFTLIEIIVALMIFSIVVVVALAALVKIIDANKKAQSTQDAVIGLSYAVESMSREFRIGSKHRCMTSVTGAFDPAGLTPQSCSIGSANNLVVFLSARTYPAVNPTCRLAYAYLFSGSAGSYILKKAQQTDCADTFTADDYTPVVSSNVTLDDFRLGTGYNAVTQPYPITYVKLSGYAGPSEKVRTYFNVQTTSASRVQ